MKSRLIAGAAALVAAIIGIALVLSYAQGADARAMAGMQPAQVLVVVKPVPAGTAADKLADFIQARTLPAEAIAPSALHTLDGTAGKVTTADLQTGEQLLAERLADPQSLVKPGTVRVPAGLQEVSFQLDPQRAVGGLLAAGDTVGLFLSFDKIGTSAGAQSTDLSMTGMLVTSVQQAGKTSDSSASPTSAPTTPLIVTVAANAAQASRIVFAGEFGKIWLSKQPAGATQAGPGPIDGGKVYQ
ncbi:pilus assembly protein CpaB [Sinomonas atrocyanea]|uniref:Flp pilus assembly protein CpaB n=1 Tax=Sinomonas atrocyanea TaxID=37927 RepID=UPI00277D6B0F|nr:RcpC/CpaB family pilus assembly protein [Sinomonas atrocyanea]MDQ0258739.1 pilus assembly protein CpaB [Sinomonas atrocyanea]